MNLLGIFLALLLFCPPAAASEIILSESGKIIVIDGDTFYIPKYGKIRIVGIDTPERGESGFQEAK